jgi:hypothetical protein
MPGPPALAALHTAAAQGDARGVGRAFVALVDEPLDDDTWLAVFAVLDAVLDTHRRVSADLGLALRGWLNDRAPAELWSSGVASLALEVWRRTDDFHMQYLCDYAGAALLADPHDEAALDAFLEGTFMNGGAGDPYIHRGTDLDCVAANLAEGPRRTVLLGLHAIIADMRRHALRRRGHGPRAPRSGPRPRRPARPLRAVRRALPRRPVTRQAWHTGT